MSAPTGCYTELEKGETAAMNDDRRIHFTIFIQKHTRIFSLNHNREQHPSPPDTTEYIHLSCQNETQALGLNAADKSA